jgi:voltage-gated potassium channel
MVHSPAPWKQKISRIIYETDTPAGWAFDVLLILSILLNSTLIIVESIESIRLAYGGTILSLQYFFLVVFTLEYLLRILVVEKKLAYLTSFFGIIDLLAILPFYVGFIFPYARLFPVLRTLRLLRLFSIFKMARYVQEAETLIIALRASRAKITIFVVTILFIVIIVGAVMYTVEGPEYGFVNIPESMYWAVVTISTVGYGDVSPQTELGKLISSFLMIVGYGIIAVPTGIITSELSVASRDAAIEKKSGQQTSLEPHTVKIETDRTVRICTACGSKDHLPDARFCHQCGSPLF